MRAMSSSHILRSVESESISSGRVAASVQAREARAAFREFSRASDSLGSRDPGSYSNVQCFPRRTRSTVQAKAVGRSSTGIRGGGFGRSVRSAAAGTANDMARIKSDPRMSKGLTDEWGIRLERPPGTAYPTRDFTKEIQSAPVRPDASSNSHDG